MKIGLQAWGSEGDIAPFTALAAGLVKAGHEVTLAVTDNAGRDYSPMAQRFGYRLITVNAPVGGADEAEQVWQRILEVGEPIKQAELVMKFGFDPVVEQMYAASQELCATHDAVLGHFFVYPLRVAAEKSGTPVATLNVVHNTLPSREICPPGLPDLGRWSYPMAWRLVQTMVNRIFLPRVNALRVREKLAPDRDVMTQTWAADRLNFVAVSPEICRRPSDWDARHHVCGFLTPPAGLKSDELPPGMEAFLQAGDPPVYITFGSMLMPNNRNQLQTTLAIWRQAIERLGCRAILQLPVLDPGQAVADDRIFMTTWAPYLKVFPRCAMVVHHGGAGTTQSTLLAGRPSLIVAHVSDQFFWGQELERLGVAGKTLKRKGLTPEDLAARIQSVLATPPMGERVSVIGGRMAQEDGVTKAVQLIENRLT